MIRNKILPFGISSLCIILATVFLFTFSKLSICHSAQKVGEITPASPIFSPDGSEIGFIGYNLIYREPVGICTFPDGGTSLIVKNDIDIYTIDLNSNLPKLIAKIPLNLNTSLSDSSYTLLGWENNSIYLRIFYPNNESGKNHFYRINILSGQYIPLPENMGKQLESSYWGQAQFNPVNQSQWLDADSTSKSIGIYTGGGKQLNLNNKQIFQSGNPPTRLIKRIIDSASLNKLQ